MILAGGFSSNLVPLVSKVGLFHFHQQNSFFSSANFAFFCAVQEVPKALLPVANRPVLSYVLDLLESSNLKDLIVVRLISFFIHLLISFLMIRLNVFNGYWWSLDFIFVSHWWNRLLKEKMLLSKLVDGYLLLVLIVYMLRFLQSLPFFHL